MRQALPDPGGSAAPPPARALRNGGSPPHCFSELEPPRVPLATALPHALPVEGNCGVEPSKNLMRVRLLTTLICLHQACLTCRSKGSS